MKLHDLDKGEQFIFNHRKFTLLRKLPGYEDVYDCMDNEQRHRPFKGITDVEPLQKRIWGVELDESEFRRLRQRRNWK